MKNSLKISISYPPLESEKGTPLLSQNRQFQWFTDPTYIYPMVPAYAATYLKESGYEVLWDDGIAEELTYHKWFERIAREAPDVVAIETKTPVVKRHWKIIEELKKLQNPPLVVLMGDHVTALPLESFENSRVDFVIKSGDYDFALKEIADFLSGAKNQIEDGGIYTRMRGAIVCEAFRDENQFNISNLNGDCFSLLRASQLATTPVKINTGEVIHPSGEVNLANHDLNKVPIIDRNLTKWKLYAYKNGNFKYTPGTYVMAGRDCWWGKCDFCSWTTLYPGKSYRTVSVQRHLDEIGHLIEEYNVKEIFDDSGCFPRGEWLENFCRGVIEKGYNKKVVLGCNMRVGALSQEQWNLMKEANFRFVLIGLESINQSTLDRLTKGIKVEQIEETFRMAKKAGLEPHITTMVGYPWETRDDAENTIKFAKKMFQKGIIDSLQATIVVPYPGTPMFKEAKEKGWLITEDWDRYDMRESVWNSPVTSDDVKALSQDLYKAALNPLFIGRKIISIKSLRDIRYYLRAGKKVFAHLTDFEVKD